MPLQIRRAAVNFMTRYNNDPYPLKTRFKSICGTCGCSLPKGSDAYYWPSSRKVFCLKCGDKDYREFRALAADEDRYNSWR